MKMLAIRSSCLFMVLCGSALAATFPSTFEPMRMTAEEGLVFTGSGVNTSFGQQAVALGDINGDGLADLALGTDTYSDSSGIFILPGGSDIASMPLSSDSIGSVGGVYIPGTNRISALGDFNGDGLDDWLLKSEESHESPASGAAIVLGRPGPYPTPLDIDSLESGSVMRLVFDGAPVNSYTSVLSPVGDINGDGRDDLAVFSRSDDAENRSTISVVLGLDAALPTTFDIATVPSAWQATTRFASYVDGENYAWSAYYSGQYSTVDANSDGMNDLLFGENGVLYLVFGSADGLPELIDYETLDGDNGTTLLAYDPDALSDPAKRLSESHLFGYASALSFDLDGDGSHDLVFGSYENTTYRSLVHVVFARNDSWPAELNLQNLPDTAGRMIEGLAVVPQNAGDLNADGIDDWFVDSFANIEVSYGRADSTLETQTPNGRSGFAVGKTTDAMFFGSVTDTKGDFNGDGIDDLLIGSPGGYGPGVDIDELIDNPYSGEFDGQRTGLAYVVLGRRESGAPASPWNAYAALASDSIDVRWELAAGESAAGFEILSNGQVLGSPGADERSFEITDAPRFSRQTYELNTLSSTGARSAPLILSVNNDAEVFPELGGEVYSDTLAEIFWVFDNREYDVYRDGEKVDRLRAQSWLDTSYDTNGHVYRIETVTQYIDDRVLRSPPFTLPAQSGTRPPAPVTGLSFALYSEHTLEIFWEPAEWGTPPLTYEVSRHDGPVVLTTGTSLMDYDIERNGGYIYEIVSIDGNGRRSAPVQLAASTYLVLAEILPTKPDNLTTLALSDTSIRLFWEPSAVGTPATGYSIYKNETRIGRTTDTSFTLTGLERDTRYYSLNVVAYNDDGQRSDESYFSDVVTLGGPLAPSSANALAYGPRTVELFWSRVERNATSVTGYDVYRNGELIDTTDSISYMDYELEPDTEYTYTVYSVSQTGARSVAFASTSLRTPLN